MWLWLEAAHVKLHQALASTNPDPPLLDLGIRIHRGLLGNISPNIMVNCDERHSFMSLLGNFSCVPFVLIRY